MEREFPSGLAVLLRRLARGLQDTDKAPVIRAYLERWAAETQRFFGDVTATSSDDDIATVASGFPVFRIETRTD